LKEKHDLVNEINRLNGMLARECPNCGRKNPVINLGSRRERHTDSRMLARTENDGEDSPQWRETRTATLSSWVIKGYKPGPSRVTTYLLPFSRVKNEFSLPFACVVVGNRSREKSVG
jgi:hypothetical protein